MTHVPVTSTAQAGWKKLSALALVATTGLTLTVACDNSATTPIVFAVGDTTNANFQATSSALTDVATGEEALDMYDALVTQIPGAPSFLPTRMPAGGSLSPAVGRDSILSHTLVVDSILWWYIFNAVVTDFKDTITVVDSMRFLTNGQPRPANDEDTIHRVENRAHYSAVVHPYTGGDGGRHKNFEGTWSGNASFTIDNPRDTIVTINFAGSDDVDGVLYGDSSVCDITIASSKTFTDVVFSKFEGECPLSGSGFMTASVTLDCTRPNGTFNFGGAWATSVIFNGATQTWVFTNGTTRWEKTRPCPEDGPIAGARWNGMAALADIQ